MFKLSGGFAEHIPLLSRKSDLDSTFLDHFSGSMAKLIATAQEGDIIGISPLANFHTVILSLAGVRLNV